MTSAAQESRLATPSASTKTAACPAFLPSTLMQGVVAVSIRDEDGALQGGIAIDEPAAEAPGWLECRAPLITARMLHPEHVSGSRFLVHSGAFMDYFRGIRGIAYLLLRHCFGTLVQHDWPIPKGDWF